MSSVNNLPPIPREYEMSIRVRYQETDAQGRVHHSNYANYFEIGRVEMLRSCGRSYRDLEAAGIMLVVTKLTCNYHQGAQYDDLLTLKAIVTRAQGVRITHRYELYLDDNLIADGETVVAAVDAAGKVVRLPDWLKLAKADRSSRNSAQ
jgi:acyl-CoA thioester hydrolase